MAKVYLLITKSVYDYEYCVDVSPYTKFENAKKAFNEAVEEEKLNDHLMEKDNCTIEEDENDFLIYAEGRCGEDFCHIYIEEKDIIE